MHVAIMHAPARSLTMPFRFWPICALLAALSTISQLISVTLELLNLIAPRWLPRTEQLRNIVPLAPNV